MTLGAWLAKRADLSTALLPQQSRVAKRILEQPGLVVAHGLGSGKTMTSIASQDALDMPADVVVPAALVENYKKEIAKHTIGKVPITVRSMQDVVSKQTPLNNPLLIVDEAHRARNASGLTHEILERSKARKRLLLTASPLYNRPSDIAPLVNMAAGENVLPENQRDFENKFISSESTSPGLWALLRGVHSGETRVLNPDTKKELSDTLKKWVDYHESGGAFFPKVKRETVKVSMTPNQKAVYDSVMGEAPFWVKWKVEHGLPPGKGELDRLNSFLGAARQVSNTTRNFTTRDDWRENSPKITRAVDDAVKMIKSNPNARVLAYSNYIDSGTEPYKELLRRENIPFGEVTGSMTGIARKRAVEDYNNGKTPILLISSAGGEGLDLKGTRMVQVLDPHWNNEKIRQVEGRAARYKSHEHLPESERDVTIRNYVATRPDEGGLLSRFLVMAGLAPKPGDVKAVDAYMRAMADDKDKLNDQVRELLRKGDK